MTDHADSESEDRPFIRRIGNTIQRGVGRLKRNQESEVPVNPTPGSSTLDQIKRARSPIEEDPTHVRGQIKRAEEVDQPFLRRMENQIRKSARRIRKTLGIPAPPEPEATNQENVAASARNRRKTRVFGCIRRNPSETAGEPETYEMPRIDRPRRDPLELRKERVDAIYAKYGARRIPGAASTKATPEMEALQQLNERTEKLQHTEKVTDDLQHGAQSFSSTAQQLAERYRNQAEGKWYEFWKL